jgi:hypothetical protein
MTMKTITDEKMLELQNKVYKICDNYDFKLTREFIYIYPTQGIYTSTILNIISDFCKENDMLYFITNSDTSVYRMKLLIHKILIHKI